MLQTLANLAQILGAVAVIAGIAFGFTQVRQFRQQRQDALAVELMRSIQDAEFTRSLRILLEVPDNTSAAEFRSLEPTVEEAAWALGAKYETLGYLVYRGIMPIDMVEELLGGVGVRLWYRIKPWVAVVREQQGQPLIHEWGNGWLRGWRGAGGQPQCQLTFALVAGGLAKRLGRLGGC